MNQSKSTETRTQVVVATHSFSLSDTSIDDALNTVINLIGEEHQSILLDIRSMSHQIIMQREDEFIVSVVAILIVKP